MGLKFDKIELGTAELAALEHLEFPHRLIFGEMFERCSIFVFERIFFILAGNQAIIKSLEEFEF